MRVFAFGEYLAGSIYEDWELWKGPELWAAVGRALGFDLGAGDPCVMHMEL